jgi:hypothetical protein
MGTNYQPRIVTDGLVLCLDASDPKSYPGSGTVWYDRSGNGNNGTLVNGTAYSDKSMIFDGVDDYVNLGNILNIGLNDISFGGWVKRTGGDGSLQWIFSKSYRGAGVGRYWADFYEYDKLRVAFSWSNNHTNYLFNTTALINTSYHYFAVADRDGYLNLFLNGQLNAQYDISSFSNVSMSNYYPYRIGCYTDSDQSTAMYFLNGNISQHIQYNRALSPEEVLQNYNATKGRFGL